ncbi:MAG: PepSY domain-containing protein, partial [Nanoarchaeota archaeon]
NEIKKAAAENIFKRPEAKIEPLDEDKIKIDITKALEIAEKTQVKDYKQETPSKIITILQKLNMGQVYNITYVTQSFKILNFKIDAVNGKVLKTKLENIMDFKAS